MQDQYDHILRLQDQYDHVLTCLPQTSNPIAVKAFFSTGSALQGSKHFSRVLVSKMPERGVKSFLRTDILQNRHRGCLQRLWGCRSSTPSSSRRSWYALSLLWDIPNPVAYALGLSAESQGQHLALTVLRVLYSLDRTQDSTAGPLSSEYGTYKTV